jgi:hypothetical protein
MLCIAIGTLGKGFDEVMPHSYAIIFTVSMVLQGRQNMKKSIYLGPFQNKFLFLF